MHVRHILLQRAWFEPRSNLMGQLYCRLQACCDSQSSGTDTTNSKEEGPADLSGRLYYEVGAVRNPLG